MQKISLRGIYKKLSVSQLIVLGFMGVILLTAVLLSLPAAAANGQRTPLADAVFTAVSAVCVTGLTVVNTASHWSFFGQAVILVASQIGALGFMTFITMLFLFLGRQITLKERMLIQQSLNQRDLKGVVRLVKRVVAWTFILEGAGALMMTFTFMRVEQVGFLRGLWYGLFHAVASFCSAGFNILQDVSLSRYVSDSTVNFTVMLLLLLGSLGYAVWIDVLSVLRADIPAYGNIGERLNIFFKRLSLQSRVVLEVTLGLTVIGTLFFFIIEYNNPDTLGVLSFPSKWLASLFQSVTPRTLGFHTIDQAHMRYGAQLLTILFMFIGGSPGSTCGGVKTVTLVVILSSINSVVRGRNNIVLHKKNIAVNTLQKALAVVGVHGLVILMATIALTFTEANSVFPYEMLDLLFETVSAASTVGLSTGITPYLSEGGKVIITLCMFLGRIGGITVAISLSSKKTAENTLNYPDGKLIVG